MNARRWGVAALFVAILCAISYHPSSRDFLAWGDVWFIGAVFGMVMASRSHGATDATAHVWTPITRRWWHWLALITGVGCGLALAQANMPGPDLLPFALRLPHTAQMVLLVGGTMLIIWGMIGQGRMMPPCSHKTPWSAYTLLLLVAFGLRVVACDDLVHFFVDEGHFGDAVAVLGTEPMTQILTPLNAIASFTWVYPYGQRLMVDIAGPNLLGLRLVSAFVGTLNVAAMWLLGRALFDRRVAAAGMVALALYPPHIHFSRLALNNIADPLLGTLLLACLALGWRLRAPRALVLGGLCLGLSPYFYESGRLLWPVVAIVWLLVWPRPAVRRLPFITAALVALPFLYVAARSNYVSFSPRLNSQGVGGDYIADLLTSADGAAQLQAYIREQLNPAYLHLFHLSDGSAFYYGGDTGLILPIFVPFFVLGVGAAIATWRRGGGWPLLWVALTIGGNSLLIENTWTARYVIAFPAIALLISFGSLRLSDALGARQWRWHRVALIIYASASIVTYFGPHLALYNRQIRPFRDHQDAGFRAMDLPDDVYPFLLTTELFYAPHIRMMARLTGDTNPLRILLPYQFPYEQAPDLLAERDLAFFLSPEDTEVRAQLARALNHPLDGPYWSPYHVPPDKQYALYWARRR